MASFRFTGEFGELVLEGHRESDEPGAPYFYTCTLNGQPISKEWADEILDRHYPPKQEVTA